MNCMDVNYISLKPLKNLMWWMSLEDIMLNEMSQAQKDKDEQHMFSLICEAEKVAVIKVESLVVTRGWEGWAVGEMDREQLQVWGALDRGNNFSYSEA